MISLGDKQFEKYLSATDVQHAVNGVAVRINDNLKDKNPVFLVVLNGAFFFAADLIKRFNYPCELSFIKVASYQGLQASDDISTVMGAEPSLKGRHVVVVEDIVDSGNTIEAIIQILNQEEVASYSIASLFYKPDAYLKTFHIDYVGLEIEDRFIVGYGLDYNGLGRNLKDIFILKEKQMTNLVLFGPPGAGKGTQAALIKDRYELVHISTGEVFRYNLKNNTALGQAAKAYMDAGDLVPDSLTIDMLRQEVENNPQAKGFIFDGFPRTDAQAVALDELLTSMGTAVSGCVALEVDTEILVQRLLERGKTSGRSDDQDESKIRNRFVEYNEKTAVLKDFYLKQDKFHAIDGVGSIDEITQRLTAVSDQL